MVYAEESSLYFSLVIARNIQRYLIGGFLSLVFLIVVAILIYKLLKIDIVLWYRKSCGPFLNKEGMLSV